MENDHTNPKGVPPFCPSCDQEDSPFQLATSESEQVLRGEAFRVEHTVHACRHCGFKILTDSQQNNLRRVTADAYRMAHGLLTSLEIKARRNQLGMSQRKFAAYLGVGVASIQRWETYSPQDRSNDQLIREKTETAPDKDTIKWVFEFQLEQRFSVREFFSHQPSVTSSHWGSSISSEEIETWEERDELAATA